MKKYTALTSKGIILFTTDRVAFVVSWYTAFVMVKRMPYHHKRKCKCGLGEQGIGRGRARLIRSHSSAGISLEISGNMN